MDQHAKRLMTQIDRITRQNYAMDKGLSDDELDALLGDEIETQWEEVRSMVPRKCCVSSEAIPLFNKAFRGIKFDFSEEWMSAESYTFAKLKGNL